MGKHNDHNKSNTGWHNKSGTGWRYGVLSVDPFDEGRSPERKEGPAVIGRFPDWGSAIRVFNRCAAEPHYDTSPELATRIEMIDDQGALIVHRTCPVSLRLKVGKDLWVGSHHADPNDGRFVAIAELSNSGAPLTDSRRAAAPAPRRRRRLANAMAALVPQLPARPTRLAFRLQSRRKNVCATTSSRSQRCGKRN